MPRKKQFFMLMIVLQVYVYPFFALDNVDIFFATIVASLPALNSIFDQAIKNVSRIGSDIRVSLILRVQSLVPTKWTAQDERAKLPIKFQIIVWIRT